MLLMQCVNFLVILNDYNSGPILHCPLQPQNAKDRWSSCVKAASVLKAVRSATISRIARTGLTSLWRTAVSIYTQMQFCFLQSRSHMDTHISISISVRFLGVWSKVTHSHMIKVWVFSKQNVIFLRVMFTFVSIFKDIIPQRLFRLVFNPLFSRWD